MGIGWAKEVIYGQSLDFKQKRETASAKGAEVSQAEGRAPMPGRVDPKRDLGSSPPASLAASTQEKALRVLWPGLTKRADPFTLVLSFST